MTVVAKNQIGWEVVQTDTGYTLRAGDVTLGVFPKTPTEMITGDADMEEPDCRSLALLALVAPFLALHLATMIDTLESMGSEAKRDSGVDPRIALTRIRVALFDGKLRAIMKDASESLASL